MEKGIRNKFIILDNMVISQRSILYFLFCIGLYIVINLALTVALLLMYPTSKGNTSISLDYLPSLLTMALLTLYLTNVVGIKHITYHKHVKTVYVVVLGIIAAIGFYKLTRIAMCNPHSDIINTMNRSSYILLLFVVGIIGPIFEEVLFRGFIYEKVRCNMGDFSAWVISIFLSIFAHYFGSSFGAPIVTLTYWLGCIIILTMAFKYGGLISSIIVHGFMNLYWIHT